MSIVTGQSQVGTSPSGKAVQGEVAWGGITQRSMSRDTVLRSGSALHMENMSHERSRRRTIAMEPLNTTSPPGSAR